MPPTGKAQLTAVETEILKLWVKANADFKRKVIDLPATDSLRILAAAYLHSKAPQEKKYDFAFANEETIKKLNNDYRTILNVANESPALEVNLYNKNQYSQKQLEELTDIKKQIVSLNLNKLGVKDADLKIVSKFENLERLDLNFTDITAQGISNLNGLKKLEILTLSGVKLNEKDLLASLKQLPALKTVTVWESGITPSQISSLQKAYGKINFIVGFKDDGKNPLKLNPPIVKNNSLVFNSSTSVSACSPDKRCGD